MNWYYIAALFSIGLPIFIFAACQSGLKAALIGLGAGILIAAWVFGTTVLLCLAEEKSKRKK